MLTVKWTGEMATRAEVEKGGAKLDLEPGQKFECSQEVYKTLSSVDKRFKLVGEQAKDEMEKVVGRRDKEAKEEKEEEKETEDKKEDDGLDEPAEAEEEKEDKPKNSSKK